MTTPRRRGRGALGALVAIALVDAALFLFPPIQWWVGSQALAFVLGACVFVTASLFVMYRIDAAREEESA
ncbi:hypothetical protein [Galactobacter valiniphilus]|uniref:hypothetical protein n=1 Tax=Galactobacter valiniphilus TaxID=2676122 RepID=UPI0037361FD4